MTSLAPDDPRHGTRTAYTHHCCRCDACRDANADYQAVLNARLKARLKVLDGNGPPHGSISTYRNWGCRCDDCRKANTEDHYRLYGLGRRERTGGL